ncbi:cupin domain-containing protein [Sungkyunkwania multivorans]|uniref:Cupin domain-containing protein n=1 Tax=Sungkyunkwania multivorans TaxID=1173618 RepID=A0ABW3D1H4_9FLAO
MYQVTDHINKLDFEGLKIKKLVAKEAAEVLIVSLEKGHRFPQHTAPRDVLLVMLEGEMVFYINDKEYLLKTHQTFDFPANTEHSVKAIQNAKFLLIR